MHGTIADRGRSYGETMQHGRLRFFGITFKKCAAMGCKVFFQERARFCYALAAHFQDQMVFVFVAIIAHRFRQMIRQNFADQLHEFIGKMLRQEADFLTESIDTRFKIKQFR